LPDAERLSQTELAEHLRLMHDTVAEAGALAMTYFRGELRTWSKEHGDPVSEADIAVDTLLRERLTQAEPSYGWLSEETEDNADRLERRHVWIVDPIDGTRAFIEGRQEFTVVAALVEDGKPKAAAVFNPATDEMFDAISGGGARLNGKPIAVSARSDLEGAKFLASSRMMRRAIDRLTVSPATFDSVNSIAYRLALVAAGRYDATFSLAAKSDWDVAAADLVLTEAGGILSDAEGNPFTYNSRRARHPSVIGAGPAMHAILMDLIGGIDWQGQ
jgi:myo-inositol-1(or 4)-monophosphatase